MGKPSGFLEFQRETPKRRDVATRLHDYQEVYQPFPELKLLEQGARCMDCGVPFCHTGCPLGNIIPDWNDLVYRNNWKEAIRRLRLELEEAQPPVGVIENERGQGYRFVPAP